MSHRSISRLFSVAVLVLFLTACNLPLAGMATDPGGDPIASTSNACDCRSGPGPSYDLVGVLNPGQAAAVIGRSPEGDF